MGRKRPERPRYYYAGDSEKSVINDNKEKKEKKENRTGGILRKIAGVIAMGGMIYTICHAASIGEVISESYQQAVQTVNAESEDIDPTQATESTVPSIESKYAAVQHITVQDDESTQEKKEPEQGENKAESEESEAKQESNEAESEESSTEQEENKAESEESEAKQENNQEKSASEPKIEMIVTAIDYRAKEKDPAAKNYSEGWGDVTMIQTTDDETGEPISVLVDTAFYSCWPSVAAWLDDHGYGDNDGDGKGDKPIILVISHAHRDHTGQDVEKDKNGKLIWNVRGGVWNTDLLFEKYNVVEVILPPLGDFAHIKESAKKHNIPKPTILKTGFKRELGSNLTMEALFAPDNEYKEWLKKRGNNTDNNYSVLMMFTTKSGIKYLTFGDSEKEEEEYVANLVKKGEIKSLEADLLKLSHHGGKTSNTIPYLIEPIYAFHTYPDCDTSVGGAGWINGPVTDVDEYANIFSTRYNKEIRFYAFSDGTMCADADEHTRMVKFQVKLPDGTTKELITEVSRTSSHTLSDKMAEMIVQGENQANSVYMEYEGNEDDLKVISKTIVDSSKIRI